MIAVAAVAALTVGVAAMCCACVIYGRQGRLFPWEVWWEARRFRRQLNRCDCPARYFKES